MLISLLMLLVVNYVIMWGCFLVVTMVGLVKLKFYMNPPYTMATYFFVQEVGGVVFVVSHSPSSQFMAILLKGGFAPLHGWMVTIISMSKGHALLWMLTWQKLAYYYVMIHFLSWGHMMVLLVGIVLPLIQGLSSMSFKVVLFFLMSSSGNSVLIYAYYSPLLMCLLAPFYTHMMSALLGLVGVHGNMYLGLETVFVLMSLPGSIPFFFKMGSMSLLVAGGGYILVIILVLLVLNSLIVINVIVNFNYKFSPGNKHFLFLMLSYMLIPYL